MAMAMDDAIVIGAGLAGLSAAGALAAAGLRVVVLERDDHVGGRCATLTLAGTPVDHGAAFLHGRAPAFVDALASVPGVTVVPGWPRTGDGPGVPCQPDALEPAHTRLVYQEGLARCPEWLARGLDVRCSAEARALRDVPGGVEVTVADAPPPRAAMVLVTAPAPETLALLATLDPAPPWHAGAASMLSLVHTEPCRVAVARYGADVPAPPWDVSLPAWGPLQTIVNDGAKRAPGAPTTLVLHGRGAWSHASAGAAPEQWARTLLESAAARHGAWAAAPAHVVTHAWPHARVVRPSELAAPLAWTLAGGGQVAVAGDGFAPETGLEGAWWSGRRAAAMLLEARRRAA